MKNLKITTLTRGKRQALKSQKVNPSLSLKNIQNDLKPDLWPVYGDIQPDLWSCMTIH